MKEEEIVSRNPRVVSGELVFAGTRVPVRNLVDYVKAGRSLEVFLDDFPGVSREQAVGYPARWPAKPPREGRVRAGSAR